MYNDQENLATSLNVVKFSDLERTMRIDSEFYSKKNFEVMDTISKKNIMPVSQLVSVSDGNHMKIADRFSETGVPYYKGQDIHHFFIENSSPQRIEPEAYDEPYMKRSHLKRGDVLLSIVGTIGGVSLVTSDDPATCSCKLAILRPHSVNSYYLATFLNCKYGQNQIKKYVRGAVQQGLILEDMDQLFVPILNDEFQNFIQEKIIQARELLQDSINLYDGAELLLLSHLGIDESSFNSSENISVKSFNTVMEKDRFDAEYYAPKYDKLLSVISNFDVAELSDLVKIKKSIEPGTEAYQDKGIPFVRVSNLSKLGIEEPDIHLPNDIVEDVNKLYPKKDNILLSKDGTVGIAYFVDKDEEFITSSAILTLEIQTKRILPEYLTLVLNSMVTQLQAERDAGGSIIKHWRINQIGNVVVPILDMRVQEDIREMLNKSFELRRKSDELIKLTIRTLEAAVENDEKFAFEWFKKREQQGISQY